MALRERLISRWIGVFSIISILPVILSAPASATSYEVLRMAQRFASW